MKLVVGVDEVGRGSLAGPIVACAVVFPNNKLNIELKKQLRDSKALSAKQRLKIADQLKGKVIWSLGAASAAEVDKINPLQANMLAIRRAVYRLAIEDPWIIVDGNQWPGLLLPGSTLVKADAKVHQVKAASIIAKVVRDSLLEKIGVLYPEYGFEKHSGYGTKAHSKAIRENGKCAHHRVTFLRKIEASCNAV